LFDQKLLFAVHVQQVLRGGSEQESRSHDPVAEHQYLRDRQDVVHGEHGVMATFMIDIETDLTELHRSPAAVDGTDEHFNEIADL